NVGITYAPSDVSDRGTLILRSGNIQNNRIDYSDNVFIRSDIPESKKCHIGDILICARNGSKKLVGKSAIIDREGMSFGAFMALYRTPFSSYIHYYISSPYFRADFEGVSTTTINQITQENLKSRLVPLPPLAEQKRIVERLEEAWPEIDMLALDENKLNKLEKAFPGKIRASILQAAIQGKLTEQLPEDGDARDLLKEIQKEKAKLIKEGKIKKANPLPEITEDETPFDIPDNWAWCHLSLVTNLISSKPFQIFEKEILPDGLYPVVSQGKKLIEGYSNHREKMLMHEKPIIVFGDHTKNLKFIDFDFIVGADGTKLLQPLGILPEYLFRNLQYNVLSIGTRNYGRHFTFLNSVLVAVPPIEEQKRIVEKLEELLPHCDALE
ncbi:MAG: restriction endonuclease subunit S, partial [Bacillota bacterium]